MGKIVNLESLSKEELIALILQKDNKIHETSHRNIELESTIKDLTSKCEEIQLENIRLAELVKYYELIRYMRQRNALKDDSNQPTLFDVMGVEKPEEIEIQTEDVEVEAHVRHHVKKEEHIDFSHLPHEVVEHTSNTPVLCPNCGEEMNVYKWEEQEELVYIPAQVKVVVHRTPRYICRKCVNDKDHNPCVNPEVWKPLFSHSKCSSSLLAATIDYEYDMGLPSTTIERVFRDNNILISRQNLTNWILASAVYIDPIYQLMKEDLLSHEVLAADETTMEVIREEGRTASQVSYLWQYQNTIWDDKRIIMFDYKPGRKGEFAASFLKGFDGYLISDKYGGYNAVNATRCFCHVHAMRYIREAYEILPKETKNKSLEKEAYNKYQKIFKIDNDIKDKAQKLYPASKESQLKYIQEHRNETKEAFEKFLSWLKEIRPQAAMKPKFLKAINYILEDNLGFLTFLNHPKIPLGNNTVEAHFKPFIMHRNRSRFYVSPKGADIAAKIYSLMLSAKANGYTTYGYFSYLFDNIRYVDLNNKEELRKLLPYSSEIPEYYKIMTKSEIKKKIKELETQLKKG